MSSDSASTKRELLTLAADGCAITAGTFAAMIGVAFGLDALGVVPLGGPNGSGFMLVLSIFSWLLQIGGFFVGPVLVWWLHKRKFGKFEVIGGVVGFGISGFAIFPVAMVAAAVGWFVGLFTSVQYAGALAVLVILVVAFLALLIWLDVISLRDLPAGRREHVPLDVARLLASVAVAVFGAIVLIKMLGGEDAAEAFAFVLAAGVTGGVVVAVADVIARFLSARAEAGAPAGV